MLYIILVGVAGDMCWRVLWLSNFVIRMLSVQNSILYSAAINRCSFAPGRMLARLGGVLDKVCCCVCRHWARSRPIKPCIIWWSPTAFSMRILQTCLVRLLPTPWPQTERKTKVFERKTTVRHKCRDKKGKGKTKWKRKTWKQSKEPYPNKTMTLESWNSCTVNISIMHDKTSIIEP